jgi:hypothetical protein
MDRIHSWPFLPVEQEVELSSNAIKSARKSWNSPIPTAATPSRCARGHLSHHGNCSSENSSELPDSLDVFPESEDPTPTAVSLSVKAPLPLPQRRQTEPFPLLAPESSRLAPRTHSSSPTLDPYTYLHRQASNDLKRDYTLKEALEVLPNELHESGHHFVLDSVTGRFTPSCKRHRHEKASPDTGIVRDGFDENLHLQDRFYSQKPRQVKTLQRPNLQCESNARHPTSNIITKFARPLGWFRSIIFKRSTESRDSGEFVTIGHPFHPRHFRGSVLESQNLKQTDPWNQSPLFEEMSRLEQDPHLVVPALVRKLSVTGSFGPTLAESIEEVILNPMSAGNTKPLPSRRNSHQLISNALVSPFPNPQTNRTVRFHEPGRRRARPNLRIQIPPSPQYRSSAHRYHPARRPRSPPPPPASSSSEHQPDTHLSLRGGCLPISKSRNPAPHRRIDPSDRPANNVCIPPGLWYLAGGRPILSDKPGKPRYHGQPKPKRRFKNRRGLEEVDISRQRVPDAKPGEPLTFGHLRDWKRKSRPADQLNPRTGLMEPAYRSFGREFAYSASRGTLWLLRPRRKDGVSADCDGQRQGMDGQADEPMFDDHGKGGGMDRDDPDQGLGAGTGAARSEPESDMSGRLRMDGNATDAGDHTPEHDNGEHPAANLA